MAWLILVVLLVLAGVAGFLAYQNTFQQLTVSFENGVQSVTVDVYHYDHDSDSAPTNLAVGAISSNTTIKLKKGSYMLVFKGNEQYKSLEQSFSLGSTTTTISVNPEYSDSKISQLLAQEQPLVLAALQKSYPMINQLYTTDPGKLYERGTWYATTLTPKFTNQKSGDTLRVVAQKQDQSWVVITRPPAIVVSHALYPKIPDSVIRDINSN